MMIQNQDMQDQVDRIPYPLRLILGERCFLCPPQQGVTHPWGLHLHWIEKGGLQMGRWRDTRLLRT